MGEQIDVLPRIAASALIQLVIIYLVWPPPVVAAAAAIAMLLKEAMYYFVRIYPISSMHIFTMNCIVFLNNINRFLQDQ